MTRNVLLVGASGNLGRAAIPVLLEAGWHLSLNDLFSLQDRLAQAVASSMHLEQASQLSAPRLDVFEEYSRGRREWLKLEKGAMERGRPCDHGVGQLRSPPPARNKQR